MLIFRKFSSIFLIAFIFYRGTQANDKGRLREASTPHDSSQWIAQGVQEIRRHCSILEEA